jgi:hypothetical protein
MSFFRSLSGSEYCSAVHQREEEQSMTRIAIERLQETRVASNVQLAPVDAA